MPNLTFEEAVQKSRAFLDWSFGCSVELPEWSLGFSGPGRTAAEFAAWRYRLARKNEPGSFRASMRENIASAEKFRSSWNELIEMSAECIRCGDAMTPELKDFVIGVLLGTRKPPKWKKGESRSANGPRHTAVSQTVHRLEQEGFDPTRTSTKGEEACAEGGSACDAVGVALGMQYKAVEGIWGSSLTKRHTRGVLAVLRNQ